ncbi:hypothetical protein NPIL_143741 [Nephila pilipes]|uniref:Uncharacterized protein n=1 Tax=Nephila pilipes TaxID=299642 RepID=A0A8X6MPF6_NEPPI|nr:hypothetical protein NPIL_143741 [Nephila pilipes]
MVSLATMSKRFPEQHWLHVYTNSPATEAHTNVGAYFKHLSLSRGVGKHCTNFDGEMDAVHMSLIEIAGNSTALECQLLIDSIKKKWTLCYPKMEIKSL